MENQADELASFAQRKFYLLLPLVVLPFLTWFYWLVVVKNQDKNTHHGQSKGGLQTTLPQASLQERSPVSKLEFYHQAQQDSTARIKQIKKDPYRQAGQPQDVDSPSRLTGLEGSMAQSKQTRTTIPVLPDADDPDTRLVSQKLAALDRALTSAKSPAFPQQASLPAEPTQEPLVRAQWEAMMNDLQAQAAEQQPDPELEKLDGMLDKIMQIQDPEKKIEAQPFPSGKLVYAAAMAPENELISLLAADSTASLADSGHHDPSVENGFFSLEKAPASFTADGITAVVMGDQQLITGSMIRLRLMSPMKVAGLFIAQNTLLHGTVNLVGERLQVEINSVRCQNQLLAVKLMVYDLDGMAGIYIPGALSRTVAKQSISQDIQGYDLDMAGFSAATQAANAAMQTAKTFLSKKTRLTQVNVPDGYQVLLKDLKSPMP